MYVVRVDLVSDRVDGTTAAQTDILKTAPTRMCCWCAASMSRDGPWGGAPFRPG